MFKVGIVVVGRHWTRHPSAVGIRVLSGVCVVIPHFTARGWRRGYSPHRVGSCRSRGHARRYPSAVGWRRGSVHETGVVWGTGE